MKKFFRNSTVIIPIIIFTVITITSVVCFGCFMQEKNYKTESSFTYADIHIKNSIIEAWDNVKIVYPVKLDSSKQVYSSGLVKKVLSKIPIKLKKGIKEIRIVDWENPNNEKVRMELASQILPENNVIELYANKEQLDKMQITSNEGIERQLYMILLHESMHLLDLGGTVDDFKISNSEMWSDAVLQDSLIYCPENANQNSNEEIKLVFSTDYARKMYELGLSFREDLADFTAYYFTAKDKYSEALPNRAKVLEEILK